MIHLDKKTISIFLAAVIAAVSVSGCSINILESDSYNFDNAEKILGKETDTSFPSTFTYKNSLCVIGKDEHGVFTQNHSDYICGIFDLNNRRVLYAQGLFEKIEPASLTKIMTAYCAIKYGNLEDIVTVSDVVKKIKDPGATMCEFQPGDTMTLRQLLYCFLVFSGNDCGEVIAEHISGSSEEFAKLMNKEAELIGATHTHFVNPHGLSDPEHYTTAYDLYLIFNEAIKNDIFVDMISQSSYTIDYKDASGSSVSKTFNSTNRFLCGEYKPPFGVKVIGGKTGSTDQAGMCLIQLEYDEKNNPYISIVMNATSRIQLYQAHIMLMYLI